MCAYHLPKQNEMSENAFFAGMVGLVGKACAIDFMTFLKLESTLPDTALVVADPAGAPMPNGPVCQLMMTYKLAYTVKAPTVNQIVAYVKRLDGEMRGLFTHIVTSTSGTIGLIPHLQKLGMLADNVNLRTA
jgi:hypothetical protein